MAKAPPKNSVTVIGFRDLERRLGRLPGAAFGAIEPLLDRAVRRSQSIARQMFEGKRRGHGRHPGKLKRGIRAKRYGTIVVLVAKAQHSHLFERGTDPAPGKPGRQPPRAYLYPAADIVGSSLLPAMERRIKAGLEGEWNR